MLILGSPVWLPLIASAVIVVLAVYIVIWAFIAVLYSVVISFAAGSVAGIICAVVFISAGKIAQGFLFLGAGLVCAGITILLFFGFNQIAKYILILSKKILFGIKACFVRKGESK